MSRVSEHIGGINRKYGVSGIGQVPVEHSLADGSPQRIEPLPESRFNANLVGGSRMNIGVAGQQQPVAGSLTGTSAWVPVASIVGTSVQPENSPNRQDTRIEGSRGRMNQSGSVREIRPKEYWEAPATSERSNGRPSRKGYLPDESLKRRGFCNWNCCLWVSLALLALIGLGFGLWKAFASQKTASATSIGPVEVNNTSNLVGNETLPQTPVGETTESETDVNRNTSAEKNTNESSLGQGITSSTNHSITTSTGPEPITTITTATAIINSTSNATSGGSQPQAPATAPGPLVNTNECSPTFFRWNGRCIHCPEESPWNGTNCVRPAPTKPAVENSSTVTAQPTISNATILKGLLQRADFKQGSISESSPSPQQAAGVTKQTWLNPNNVPILRHWRNKQHLRAHGH